MKDLTDIFNKEFYKPLSDRENAAKSFDANILKVNFRNKEYDALLRETLVYLSEIYDVIFEKALNLAHLKQWKKWNDEQPIGTKVTFNEENLRECYDTKVKCLMDLLDNVYNTKNKIDDLPRF